VYISSLETRESERESLLFSKRKQLIEQVHTQFRSEVGRSEAQSG
jgi:hypothetical protein